jgi:hypothetical protein
MNASARYDNPPLLLAGLTAVFIGYLTVWLPGPAAGLSFLGVELGEWIKFLGVGQTRNLFYLPPITLALSLVALAATWPNGRWQTWTLRGLALAVSLLAFPALPAIRGEPTGEWALRLALIGLVGLLALLTGLVVQLRRPRLVWGALAALGGVGALAPLWLYLTIRPLVSQAFGAPVGIGIGVWLNGVGHLLLAAVSLLKLRTA